MLEFTFSLVNGFLLGALVLAILVYLEFWWKNQEVGKLIHQKKRILDQLEERERSKFQQKKRATAQEKKARQKQQNLEKERVQKERQVREASKRQQVVRDTGQMPRLDAAYRRQPEVIATENTTPLFDSLRSESNKQDSVLDQQAQAQNMAEQPTERDLIGCDLLKQFMKIYHQRLQFEVVSSTADGKTVRCSQTEDGDNQTIMEMESTEVTPEQFKLMFQNMGRDSVELVEECTHSELFCTEDGQRCSYETVVQTHKFPFLYERIIVTTQYNWFDHNGRDAAPDSHICITSSKGNEKFMNKESVGGKLDDGYRVYANVSLSGYLIQPLFFDGSPGVKIFFVSKSQSPGVPFYLFKRFVSGKLSSIFDRILSLIKKYN